MTDTKLHKIAKQLIFIRGLRSIGQGAMVVDLTLYLKDIEWSGSLIGSVISISGLFGAGLILLVGILSDRIGRKPFLLIYESLIMLSAIFASLTTKAFVLILGIVIAGFGRGQTGSAGPFNPAEQAWLARYVETSKRGKIFSMNNAVGFIGMAIGAFLGGIPSLIETNEPLIAYRPVFLLVAFISLISMIILVYIKEEKPDKHIVIRKSNQQFKEKIEIGAKTPKNENDEASLDLNEEIEEEKIQRVENATMLKLALVNTVNGIAVGLTGPMMAYWFSVKYGVDTGAIGLTVSLSFLLTGIFSIFNGYLAERIGMVKSVTWMRVFGSVLFFVLPWMPTFLLASILYIIRNAINRGTQGNRAALSASITRDHRRGLATSINAMSMRLPASVGPTITGYLLESGLYYLPLVLTATLQLANAGLYQWIFGKFDKK